jgi:hypothetical protein
LIVAVWALEDVGELPTRGSVPSAVPVAGVQVNGPEDLGPHRVTVTVPLGTPATVLPVTATVSWTLPDVPMAMWPDTDAWVLVVVAALVTLKHSLSEADATEL